MASDAQEAIAHKLGLIPVNVGSSVRQPKAKDSLVERILSEVDIQLMILLSTHPRNRALLRLLYSGGLRVSELCALKWKDLNARGESGQVTVFGKGERRGWCCSLQLSGLSYAN